MDLLNLRDTLHALNIKAKHVPSSENVADMWTKAISAQTLVHLKSLIGREAGHAQLFANLQKTEIRVARDRGRELTRFFKSETSVWISTRPCRSVFGCRSANE